ncbi:MAG: hypothetical protein IK053_05735 [Muribaculaceae bacterium]|nr:hypothetical protein [Muribaculaceae bacterium]
MAKNIFYLGIKCSDLEHKITNFYQISAIFKRFLKNLQFGIQKLHSQNTSQHDDAKVAEPAEVTGMDDVSKKSHPIAIG